MRDSKRLQEEDSHGDIGRLLFGDIRDHCADKLSTRKYCIVSTHKHKPDCPFSQSDLNCLNQRSSTPAPQTGSIGTGPHRKKNIIITFFF